MSATAAQEAPITTEEPQESSFIVPGPGRILDSGPIGELHGIALREGTPQIPPGPNLSRRVEELAAAVKKDGRMPEGLDRVLLILVVLSLYEESPQCTRMREILWVAIARAISEEREKKGETGKKTGPLFLKLTCEERANLLTIFAELNAAAASELRAQSPRRSA